MPGTRPAGQATSLVTAFLAALLVAACGGDDPTGPPPPPEPSFDFDRDLIAFETQRDGNREIYLMSTDGADFINITNNGAADGDAAWSPDGTRIAFASTRTGGTDVYVMDVDGGNVTRLTDDPAVDRHPYWSPDGSRIAFATDRDGNSQIYIMNADGSNPQRISNSSAIRQRADLVAGWVAHRLLFGPLRQRRCLDHGQGRPEPLEPDGQSRVRLLARLVTQRLDAVICD